MGTAAKLTKAPAPSLAHLYKFVVDADGAGWLPLSQSEIDQRKIDSADNAAAKVKFTAAAARAAKDALIATAIKEQQRRALDPAILAKIESEEITSGEGITAALDAAKG